MLFSHVLFSHRVFGMECEARTGRLQTAILTTRVQVVFVPLLI
jgi:hypothetical protein